MDVDFEELAMFVEALEATDFSHFVYSKGDVRIEVKRGPVMADPSASVSLAASSSAQVAPPPQAATPVVSAPAASAPAVSVIEDVPHEATEGDIQITAPLLGTVYLSPKPGEPSFVEVGARVAAGAPVCIIEVMKLMNSVEAPVDGTIVARHVSDGDLVEFGQVVFTIRPDGQ